jgi:hypothetical protein
LTCAECCLLLAVLRSFFHSSPLYTFSCHSSPSTILPSPPLLHLSIYFLVYLLVFLIPNAYIIPLWEFSPVLCTYPNQRNLCSFIVSVMVGGFFLLLTTGRKFFPIFNYGGEISASRKRHTPL